MVGKGGDREGYILSVWDIIGQAECGSRVGFTTGAESNASQINSSETRIKTMGGIEKGGSG